VQLLVERLARAVADGLLKPGECLPSERDFADELGVSRSVVREAFSALAATGLIARREGRGNFVAEVPDPGLLRERALSLLDSSPDPYDVCLAREALEPALASAVGMNATDEDFGKLASALNTLARACASRDWKAYFSADQQFHAALVASTHNRALVQAMEPLLNGMQAPIWTTLKQAYFLEHPANAEKSAQDHGQILAAVLERNASKLSESLRQHFLDVRSVLEYGISRGEPGQEVGAEGGAGESRVRTPT
jgi:DNA-binding FadR family transcriptional regulator